MGNWLTFCNFLIKHAVYSGPFTLIYLVIYFLSGYPYDLFEDQINFFLKINEHA